MCTPRVNLNWKNYKTRGLINHINKSPLELFNKHEECFIKFGSTNDYTLNKLL